MARVEICDGCGRKWQVSALRPKGKVYLCPDCDRIRGGPRYPIYLLKPGQDR